MFPDDLMSLGCTNSVWRNLLDVGGDEVPVPTKLWNAISGLPAISRQNIGLDIGLTLYKYRADSGQI